MFFGYKPKLENDENKRNLLMVGLYRNYGVNRFVKLYS
jgi:hypothetical protein